MKRWVKAVAAIIFCLPDYCVLAATIQRAPDTRLLIELEVIRGGQDVGGAHQSVTLSGDIATNDAEVLKTLVAGMDRARGGQVTIILYLDSQGGNFSEALKLSKFVRERGIVTAVMNGYQCLSACAVVFFGGRHIVHESDAPPFGLRILEPGGLVGLHRPRLELSFPPNERYDGEYVLEKTEHAYSVAAKQVGELITEFRKNDVRESLAAEMLKVTEGFFYIDTIDKAGRWNVTIAGLIYSPMGPERAAAACSNINRWRNDYYVGHNDVQFQDFLPSTFSVQELAKTESASGDWPRASEFQYWFPMQFEGQGCGLKARGSGAATGYTVSFFEPGRSVGEFFVEPQALMPGSTLLTDLVRRVRHKQSPQYPQ